MSLKDVFVIGSGGHAKVIADSILAGKEYKLCGFIEQKESDQKLMGVPVLAEDYLGTLKQAYIVIGIGENNKRKKIADSLKSRFSGVHFVSVIHPSAVVSPAVKIGEGTVIMAGAVINIDTIIAKHCIINTKASIDHDCKIENFASIGPGACLGGTCHIGELSLIGLGASVIQGMTIGSNTVVGAGAAIIKSVSSNKLVVGVPGKVLKDRQIGDSSL